MMTTGKRTGNLFQEVRITLTTYSFGVASVTVLLFNMLYVILSFSLLLSHQQGCYAYSRNDSNNNDTIILPARFNTSSHLWSQVTSDVYTSNESTTLTTVSPSSSPKHDSNNVPTSSSTEPTTATRHGHHHYHFNPEEHLLYIIMKTIVWIVLCIGTMLGIIFAIQNSTRIYYWFRLMYFKVRTCLRPLIGRIRSAIRYIYKKCCCCCSSDNQDDDGGDPALTYALLSDDDDLLNHTSNTLGISMEESSLVLFDDDPNTEHIIFPNDDLMTEEEEELFRE